MANQKDKMIAKLMEETRNARKAIEALIVYIERIEEQAKRLEKES